MRKPANPPPALTVKADRIIMVRHYRLITPLYGGGVEPGKVDTEVTPIRGTSIRGQLRFWWRATRGGKYGSREEMKKAEGELWGSTKTGSSVSVRIVEWNAGAPYDGARDVRRNRQGERVDIGKETSDHSYVAFPLREERDEHREITKPAGVVHQKVNFKLQLSFPNTADIREQMRAALWAWDTFGGVGARTRRGFGALACEKVDRAEDSAPFEAQDWRWDYQAMVKEDIEDGLRRDIETHVSPQGRWPDNVPHLSPDMTRYRVVYSFDRAEDAWKHLFGALKRFRQARVDRGAGVAPGRSHWPEPDAIRDRTGQKLNQPAVGDHRTATYRRRFDAEFPRAAFGLPIIFAFHRDHVNRRNPKEPDYDPRQTTLAGVDHDRLASPLILRPLACRNKRYVGLAVVLEGSRPPTLQLKDGDGTVLGAKPSVRLSRDDATELAKRHKAIKSTTTDVLQAFLDTLGQETKHP